MKKIALVITGLVFFINSGKTQNWDSVGCNGLWAECGGFHYSASCLMVYNGALYAGGPIGSAGTFLFNDIGKWNGTSWDSLQGGMPTCGGPDVMIVYNNKLIVGGDNITQAGRIAVNNIAAWNDTTWSQLGSGISVNGYVLAMAVYNGNLYVTGRFDTAGGMPVNNIAKWDGTSWSAVGMGVSGNGGYGLALCVYDNKLYVGGNFTSAGGNPAQEIATWDGSIWATLPGIPRDTGYFCSFTTFNGNLYAGGVFDSVGTVKANNIAQWNGTSWATLGSGVRGEYLIVSALQNYNGNLFVGGTFDTAGGIPVDNFAEWDGTNWHHTPGFTGVWGTSTIWVGSLTVYNGYMFACGAFDTAGGVHTIDIAGTYGGGTGINELKGESGKVKVYPNPSNGQFTLEVDGLQAGMKNLEVYNVLGDKVFAGSLPSNVTSNVIDLKSQPNGVYLYRVIAENGNLLGQGKIVIEK